MQLGTSNHYTDSYGRTPLHYAAAEGNAGAVKLLLAEKADIDDRDRNGSTPLQLATKRGHKEIVAMLRAYASKR